jgi:VWFA-related protein
VFRSSSISQLFRRSKIALLLVALLANGIFEMAVSTPYAMPQEPQTLTKPLQYEVTVTLKLIQVCITDKKGRPVRDLTKTDFVLFDDGKPATLTEFEKHDVGLPAAEIDTTSSPGPGGATARPQSLGRTFFLFFDFAFNSQKGIVKAIEAGTRFLKSQFQTNDRVALVTYSMLRGITVHEYLTPDLDKIREALAGLSGKEVSGRADEIEQEYWQQAADLAPTGLGDRRNADAARLEGQRRESKSQAHFYLLRLTALAQALRLVPGQKTILFFSTGVPYSLIFGNQSSTPDTQAHASAFDMGDSLLRPLYEQMVKEFAASNCAFYALDTRESAKVSNLFAYDEQRADAFEAMNLSVFSTKTDIYRDDKTTGLGSLTILSKDTGGQYFGNISRYDKSLDQIQSLTGTYYVLGYRTSQAEDGRFHEIKVEVKRPGCQVRGQVGYFNPKPFRDYSKLEKDIQLFDLALNERSGGQAPKIFPMTTLAYDAGEGLRLRALARIPKDVIEFFGGKAAELIALFFDGQENVLSLQRTTADLNNYKGADLLFTSGIAPPAGAVKCRLVIRDLETGQSAVASAKVFLVKPEPARIAVATPLLLIPEAQIRSLDGTAKGKLDPLSWHDIYPFDPGRYAPVVGEEPVRAARVVIVVPFTLPGADEHDVVFSSYLINSANGQNLPVAVQPVNRFVVGHVHAQLLEMALDQVPSGKYMVYVNAGDRTAGALASGHVPLTINR